MAPTLRESTQAKTQASADAAVKAGYKRRTPSRRKPLPRNKRFRSTKGLVNLQKPNGLQHLTDANANSPLLRLPPELRNVIFKFAMNRYSKNVTLYFNGRSQYSASGCSSHTHRSFRTEVGLHLPEACRQIYAETATLIYKVNKFSFGTKESMMKWLSRRLPAQLEAIEHVLLNDNAGSNQREIFLELKGMQCQNLCSLTRNDEAAIKVQHKRESSWSWDEYYPSTDDEEGWRGFDSELNRWAT